MVRGRPRRHHAPTMSDTHFTLPSPPPKLTPEERILDLEARLGEALAHAEAVEADAARRCSMLELDADRATHTAEEAVASFEQKCNDLGAQLAETREGAGLRERELNLALESAREEIEELNRRLATALGGQARIQEMEVRLSALEPALAQARAELEPTKAERDALAEKLERVQKRVVALEARAADAEGAATAVREELFRRRREAQQVHRDLQDRLEQLLAEREAADSAAA